MHWRDRPGGGGTGGGGGDPFTVVAPVTMLDEKVTGYIMKHAASSGRQIRAALGCQLRDLRPSLARLSAAGRIACDTGLRSAKLWSVTTSGSPPATPMFEPVEPVLVHATGSVNVYGVEPDEPVLVQPVQTLVNQTTEPDDLNQTPEPDGLHGDLPLASTENTPPPLPTGGAGEPAKHEKSCPKCFGTGLDAVGKPCDWDEYQEQRKNKVQVRWAAGQAPPDGAHTCAICGRYNGKAISFPDGVYTAIIPTGDDTCVRCQACDHARAAGQPAPGVRDHDMCWTANEGTVH